MNGKQHEALTRRALKMVGVPCDQWAHIIAASSAPDRAACVLVSVPGGSESVLFGKPFASLLHFQRSNGDGFCWDSDPSLGVLDGLGDVVMRIAGSIVTCTADAPGPLRARCEAHQRRLCDFVFPSAVAIGSWLAFEGRWEWLHYLHDVLIGHHIWGALRLGHQDHEDDMQEQWRIYCQSLELASESGLFEQCPAYVEAVEACRGITTAQGLIESNAAWARARFGEPHDMPECGPIDAIAVGCRAVASTMRGLQLMKGNA